MDAIKQDIAEAKNQHIEQPLAKLRVDGGMTNNTTLLQMQADVLGSTVGRDTRRDA